jgi:hypothetical protein
MTVAYRTLYEYSRVVETVALTEDGVYVKDRTPDSYGGSILNVEIVHRVTMMDSTGYVEELRFENPIPKSKEGNTDSGKVTLDGNTILEGNAASDPRTWTTRLNEKLTDYQKNLGKYQVALVKADREAAGGTIL